MTMSWIDIASWALLMGGSFFLLVGAIGIMRLPDIYTRLHAAGVTDTLGAFLILAGLFLQAGLTIVGFKLVLILIFLWFTSPVSSHALGQAALYSGRRPILSANHMTDKDEANFHLPHMEVNRTEDKS